MSDLKIDSSVLPLATANAPGAINLGYTKNYRNYPLEVDAENKAFVNVPWIDLVILSITYADLKNLRDTGLLIPGKQYRIIDYEASTTQEATYALNDCVFDIIVTADYENTLNENARAAYPLLEERLGTNNEHCYFEKWELKYNIDNGLDLMYYAWGDPSGKGLIYYLKDEHNNVCHFDWKNILIDSTCITWGDLLPYTGYMYLFDLNGGATDLSMVGFIKNANIENYIPIDESAEYIPLLVISDLSELVYGGIPINSMFKIDIKNSNDICIFYSRYVDRTLYNDFELIYNNYGINPVCINIKDSYSIVLENVFGDVNIYKSEDLRVGINGIPYCGSELKCYKAISSVIYMYHIGIKDPNIYDCTGYINKHRIQINNSNTIRLMYLNSSNDIIVNNCLSLYYMNEIITNTNNIILKNIVDPNAPISTSWHLHEDDLSIKDIVFITNSEKNIKSYCIEDILINL